MLWIINSYTWHDFRIFYVSRVSLERVRFKTSTHTLFTEENSMNERRVGGMMSVGGGWVVGGRVWAISSLLENTFSLGIKEVDSAENLSLSQRPKGSFVSRISIWMGNDKVWKTSPPLATGARVGLSVGKITVEKGLVILTPQTNTNILTVWFFRSYRWNFTMEASKKMLKAFGAVYALLSVRPFYLI